MSRIFISGEINITKLWCDKTFPLPPFLHWMTSRNLTRVYFQKLLKVTGYFNDSSIKHCIYLCKFFTLWYLFLNSWAIVNFHFLNTIFAGVRHLYYLDCFAWFFNLLSQSTYREKAPVQSTNSCNQSNVNKEAARWLRHIWQLLQDTLNHWQ